MFVGDKSIQLSSGGWYSLKFSEAYRRRLEIDEMSVTLSRRDVGSQGSRLFVQFRTRSMEAIIACIVGRSGRFTVLYVRLIV